MYAQWRNYHPGSPCNARGPRCTGDPTPPVLGHFVERNSMGSKIWMYIVYDN